MKKEGQGVIKRPVSLSEKKKKPELLAPGGSFAAAKAVLDAGADSVYTGLTRFSARAYAKNLNEEELKSLLDYAHLFGKTVHLTLNTLFKNREIKEAAELVGPFYASGLDAVLVQDIGLLSLLHKHYPLLPLHASTQMNLCTAGGAKLLKEQGIKRVVLPRELSLTQIRKVKAETGLEVEVFCHGALCCSYSGQCQMSAQLGGRSANRGRCAGPCRLPYISRETKKRYLFSMKDLCTLDHLPLLQSCGVDSLKIEGRHKSIDYALWAVEIYRKYLDRLEREGEEGYFVEEKDRELLLSGGSRSGFTDRYLFVHNDPSLFSEDNPSYRKGEAALPPAALRLPVRAAWEVRTGREAALTLTSGDTKITVRGAVPEKAKNRALEEETLKKKTETLGETPFLLSAFEADLEEGVFLPLSEIKRLKHEAFSLLQDRLLEPCRRSMAESAVVLSGLTPYEWSKPFFTALVSEEGQLVPSLAAKKLRRIVLSSLCFPRKTVGRTLPEAMERIRKAGKEAGFSFPAVLREADITFFSRFFADKEYWPDVFYVSSQDGLALLETLEFPKERIVLDQLLYAWSNETKAAFQRAGYLYDTIPAELKKAELMHRENGGSELIIYGRQPLMHMAGCLFQRTTGCHKAFPVTRITDRQGEEFFVRADCDSCMNILLNGHVLNLLQEPDQTDGLKVRSYRYVFTLETPEEVEGILKGEPLEGVSSTKGLFMRGVE
ncbi:MAG: U32 family peptidase [Lachnospiraceae bacterium]|nr:U32 family peptidase [Lachnospiraceae bacterium]